MKREEQTSRSILRDELNIMVGFYFLGLTIQLAIS